MKAVLIILLLVLTGCEQNSNKEIVVLTQEHSVKDLTEMKVELYEVNVKLYPILDSVIEATINCSEYFNQQLGFELLFYNEQANNDFIITNILDLNFQYYLIYDGVFYYKGYQFGIIEPINEHLLKKINRKVTLYSISKQKYEQVYIDNTQNSHWIYRYNDDGFTCIEIKRCGKLIK